MQWKSWMRRMRIMRRRCARRVQTARCHTCGPCHRACRICNQALFVGGGCDVSNTTRPPKYNSGTTLCNLYYNNSRIVETMDTITLMLYHMSHHSLNLQALKLLSYTNVCLPYHSGLLYYYQHYLLSHVHTHHD